MRYFLVALIYLVSLCLVAAATFIVVIVAAGPHAGLLPQWAEVIVLGAGWVAVVGLPIVMTQAVWRRWISSLGR
jgi:hypothetical protein